MRPGEHLLAIAAGLIGWTVVLGLPAAGVLPNPTATSSLWLALFTLVILAARALAFRVVATSELSLDSAYHVAATLCVGTGDAARVVAIALTIDAVARLAWRQRRTGQVAGWAEAGQLLRVGGVSGGLVALCGWAGGADTVVGQHPGMVEIAARVAAIHTLLLASHHALHGLRVRLAGGGWRAYLDDVALAAIGAEATLMPIGAVLVGLYDPYQPLGFLLLSLTYLLINLGFSRLSRTRKQLEERVHELEILTATARRLAASLQLEELVEAVARETCRAIPEAEAVSLVHRRARARPGDPAGEQPAGERELVVDSFDRLSEKFFRRSMTPGAGAVGWVMSHGAARRIDDLSVDGDVASHGGVHGIRAWLGVPLHMYGGCEGVIAVQSTHARAFRDHHQRLLESLALQIAAALQNAHLYELAMVDGLTGLFMRRYFDARIDEEIERSRRYGTAFSVVMMDVDDFKRLNDTHGHLIGDRVLRGIANVVKSQMRGVDTASRYGGEEIAVILPRTEMINAYNVGERIRGAISELRITTDGDPPQALRVTASFGIASYPDSKASSGEDLIRRADRALYRAKQTGKNRVELFWADDGVPRRPPTCPADEDSRS